MNHLRSITSRVPRAATLLRATVLLAASACLLPAQQPKPVPAAPAADTQPAPATAPAPQSPAVQTPTVSNKDKRRAIKLYLAATKLFDKSQFEEAMQIYQQVVAIDPTNPDYAAAVEVARSHVVTALVQQAAKDRIRDDAAAARAALAHAAEIDPQNPLVTEHLRELANDAVAELPTPRYERPASTIGESVILAPTRGKHSFHFRTDERSMIQQVFRAYGLEATVDLSIRAVQMRFDIDNATFEQATLALSRVTGSFFVPLDPHRAIVARNTREFTQQFTRQEMETIYLPALTQTELTDVGNLAKNVFDAPQSVIEQSSGTITLRAPQSTLDAFNTTLQQLMDGRSQVLLDVRLIQLTRTRERKTGAQFPQSMSVFNVYAEARSILNANQDLVNQIIASGLVSPSDIIGIIAILLASGQVQSPLLSGGFVTVGGGVLGTTAITPGPVNLNLNLNSSDTRELDQIQLRLTDGEAGTLKMGTRYPIQTASYSLGGSSANIPGITGAGNSGALGGLLSNLSSIPPIPQLEYQDLGMTLKATPRVIRNGDVALTLDLKIQALSGSSVNGNPVLNNRAYSGVVTLPRGEAVAVLSELTVQETRAISGVPGITELPGLNNVTSKDVSRDTSSLLIVITPHVIRGTQAAGHSPMMHVEKVQPAR